MNELKGHLYTTLAWLVLWFITGHLWFSVIIVIIVGGLFRGLRLAIQEQTQDNKDKQDGGKHFE